MLDHVGDVGVVGRDPGTLKAFVEHASRGPHERVPLEVLTVSRLLADQHQRGPTGPLTHDGLGCAGVQITCPAGVHGALKAPERRPLGHWRGRVVRHLDDGLPG
jgi:hypothetical protein